MYTYIHKHTYIYLYIYTYIHEHTFIHAYIQTRAHTHIHTHTHTHTAIIMILFCQDLLSVGYQAPHWAAEYLMTSGASKDSKILDCGAGTGLIGEILRARYNFTGHIDALDGSKEMLDVAQEKKVYNGFICSFIGNGATVPIDDSMFVANLCLK